MRKKLLGTLLFSVSFMSHMATAQELDSLMNLNAFTQESELQKILNKSLSVSSQKALTTRETPGIISLVTADEIQRSGARDLVDVLRLVPGFEVLQDLQFVEGIGLRGNWANEGKVLVMLDGQPFNDLLYQTVAVGNRFPVDAIERIEIIRGPGSAIYGGSAEYGVVNIITKSAESLDGVAVYGTGGFHSGGIARSNAGLMVAGKGGIVSWDFSLFKGDGIVSDRPYAELSEPNSSPAIYNLQDVTKADPANINLGIRYKGLSVRTMYDQYETADPFTIISYKSYFVDALYKAQLGDRLSITPRLRYMHQIPWTWDDNRSDEEDFRVQAERLSGQVDANYNASRKVNLSMGVVYFKDKGKDLLDGQQFAGSNTIELTNVALYAEGLFKHRLFNATAGMRYEKNNRYGSAFVPRVALTKKLQNFHFKVLYSESFRAPSIQNINIALTGKAAPERSSVFELELGYQFTPEMLLAVNLFSITTRDVLIYGSDGEGDTFVEWYENLAKSGSNGAELVYSIRKKSWYATLTYSYNRALSGNTVETYAVPGESQQYVGFPASKVTLNGSVNLHSKLSVNPSFIIAGTRYAYTSLDEDEEPVIEALDPYMLANIFLLYKQSASSGFTVGVGTYDMFNQRPAVVQAYNGGYAPIPGRSREYVVKLMYQINFKQKQ